MRLVAALAAATAIGSPTVASVQLPRYFNYYSVEAAGANVYVSGDTVVGGSCAAVIVAEASLRVTSHGVRSCDDASPHRVYPVTVRAPRSFDVRVRIARADHRTHHVSLGPVVMTFQQVSDTHLQSVYGPRTLWLFDAATPRGAEVLQVSATTGHVENAVPMPRLDRPVLAADEDGLWLGIATNGGAGNGPAPIYHIGLGAPVPTLVHRGGRAALWMIATGHTVWADVLTGPSHGELWRFDGPSAQAHALAPADELNTWAASVSSDGSTLWTVREVPVGGGFSCKSVDVIEIDARTGAQVTATHVPISKGQCYDVTYSTFIDGAFFFLLDNRLYRVAA